MNTHIDFYCYSGTGNTLLVAQEMMKVFEDNSITVELHRIEETDPRSIRTDRTIGLAFPVAFQSTFPFLWDFFQALPRTKGTEIFMVDTMMAFSGAIVGPLKKILKPKGYNCIGAKEIIMPSNWFVKRIDREKNQRKVLKGLNNARSYALDLINGRSSWTRIPLLSDIFYRTCCNDYMMENVNTKPGKKITLDHKKCTGCGQCAKLCPIGNIIMEDGKPRWSSRCQTCMRCMSFCPRGAVTVTGKEFVPYRAVKPGELIVNRRNDSDEVA